MLEYCPPGGQIMSHTTALRSSYRCAIVASESWQTHGDCQLLAFVVCFASAQLDSWAKAAVGGFETS